MKSLRIILIFLSGVSLAYGQTERKKLSTEDSTRFAIQEDSARKEFHKGESKMKFSVQPQSEESLPANNLRLVLEFKNISNEGLRLFDSFKTIDELNTNIFLSINCLSGEDKSKQFLVLNSPITDFYDERKLKFIVIPKGQSFKKTINLSEILKARNKIALKPGIYLINATYRNNHRRDFIRGNFDAPDIKIIVN